MPKMKSPSRDNVLLPKQRMVDADAADKRFDDDMEKTLHSHLLVTNERAKKKYDGVVGTLPDWMPPDSHLQFEDARNRLLTQLSHSEILSYLKKYGQHFQKNYDGSQLIPIAFLKHISMLHYIQKAVSLDETKGLAWLVGPIAAGKIEKGRKYSTHQSNIAKRPRGKVGDNGENIEHIIDGLSRDEEATAQDLWGHFYSALDDRGLNPKETSHKPDPKKSTITYDFKDGRKPITFGRFANALSQRRKRKGKSR